MLLQDAGLDALHSVILKQKGMAQQIGVEIVQQNDIIDEIGQCSCLNCPFTLYVIQGCIQGIFADLPVPLPTKLYKN